MMMDRVDPLEEESGQLRERLARISEDLNLDTLLQETVYFPAFDTSVGPPETLRPAGLLQTFQIAAIRHLGHSVGNIYLVDKEAVLGQPKSTRTRC